MIEMFVRLGLALMLSLSLAILLAWGWNNSDQYKPADAQQLTALTSDVTSAN